MKKSLILLSILALLGLANLFMSGNDVEFMNGKNLTAISPISEKREMLIKLYFVEDRQLVSEIRNIEINTFELENAILKALKSGPRIATALSPLRGDVEILSVEVKDRVCYVNLTSDFKMSDDEMYFNSMAITNTLTEFENIDYVQILVEGNKINARDSRLDFPLAKDTSIVHEIELLHKDIVNKFLNYIIRGRYDLAYDLIDIESKSFISFRDFLEQAVVIRESIRGYTQSYIFAKEDEDGFLIQVKYKLQNQNNYDYVFNVDQEPREIIFSWGVIQEDGIWRIRFFD
jgi:hypothetical protein